jgi:hypothetical protein
VLLKGCNFVSFDQNLNIFTFLESLEHGDSHGVRYTRPLNVFAHGRVEKLMYRKTYMHVEKRNSIAYSTKDDVTLSGQF